MKTNIPGLIMMSGIFVYEIIDLYLVKNYYYRTNE